MLSFPIVFGDEYGLLSPPGHHITINCLSWYVSTPISGVYAGLISLHFANISFWYLSILFLIPYIFYVHIYYHNRFMFNSQAPPIIQNPILISPWSFPVSPLQILERAGTSSRLRYNILQFYLFLSIHISKYSDIELQSGVILSYCNIDTLPLSSTTTFFASMFISSKTKDPFGKLWFALISRCVAVTVFKYPLMFKPVHSVAPKSIHPNSLTYSINSILLSSKLTNQD